MRQLQIAQMNKTKKGLGDGAITSTIITGKLYWEEYIALGRPAFQLEYRHTDGELFACCGRSRKICRQKLNEFLNINYGLHGDNIT